MRPRSSVDSVLASLPAALGSILGIRMTNEFQLVFVSYGNHSNLKRTSLYILLYFQVA